MRFGPGILPSLTIMSNNEGEIPTYAAASARDKPRGGRECGSTFLDFPVFSGVKLAVRLEGTANYEAELRLGARTLDHARETCGGER